MRFIRALAVFIAAATAISLVIPEPTAAHLPIFTSGGSTMETAFKIPDANVSYAITAEFTSQTNRIHFYSFSVEAGHVLSFQLAVPAISSLEDFAPVVMLIGPDLPDPDSFSDLLLEEFEIELVSGSGAITFLYDGIHNEREFEPFTQVNLWTRQEVDVALPSMGVYYLAVAVPAVWPGDADSGYGKYMLAPGLLEEFSILDYMAIPLDWIRWHSFWEDSLPILLVPTFLVVAVVTPVTWSYWRHKKLDGVRDVSGMLRITFIIGVIGAALMIGSAVNQLILVLWNSISSFETTGSIVMMLQTFGMILGIVSLLMMMGIAKSRSMGQFVLALAIAAMVTFGALVVGAGWILGPVLFVGAYSVGLTQCSRMSPKGNMPQP